MKHLLKTYEHEGITCDMRSSRKLFFPIMLDGKKIADIEDNSSDMSSLNHDENINGFNVHVLESLDSDICNNLFELLSKITNENKIDKVTFTSIDKFSRYRRKRDEDGELAKFADDRYSRLKENNVFKNVYNKFMSIRFNGYEKIISKETYKRLLDEGINVEHNKESVLPRILLGGESVNIAFDDFPYLCIDDFDTLKNIEFKVDATNKTRHESTCSFYLSVNNKDHNEKITLPKITMENLEGNERINFYFMFDDMNNGKWIDFSEQDFDFSNFPNVSEIKQAHGGVVSFIEESGPKHENDLSL